MDKAGPTAGKPLSARGEALVVVLVSILITAVISTVILLARSHIAQNGDHKVTEHRLLGVVSEACA